ncbi:hypothetical protein FB451DRAFT_1192522 [Mycena latifolia]|nr:hypothetical protein FB451DRAFT_1192522 [Mycena latifolia]
MKASLSPSFLVLTAAAAASLILPATATAQVGVGQDLPTLLDPTASFDTLSAYMPWTSPTSIQPKTAPNLTVALACPLCGDVEIETTQSVDSAGGAFYRDLGVRMSDESS